MVDCRAPLGVEDDDVVWGGGEVDDFGAVGVAAAGAVGLRVPAEELAAVAHEAVGGKSESLAVDAVALPSRRARGGAVAVEGNSVYYGLPMGVERVIGHGHDGIALGSRLAAGRCGEPTFERVAGIGDVRKLAVGTAVGHGAGRLAGIGEGATPRVEGESGLNA